jgi:aspartyl aminopeptidase
VELSKNELSNKELLNIPTLPIHVSVIIAKADKLGKEAQFLHISSSIKHDNINFPNIFVKWEIFLVHSGQKMLLMCA